MSEKMTAERLAEIEIDVRSEAGWCAPPSEVSAALIWLMDDVRRLRSVIDRSSGIIRTLLASARPRPIEHPTMAAAWAEARIYLGDAGDES